MIAMDILQTLITCLEILLCYWTCDRLLFERNLWKRYSWYLAICTLILGTIITINRVTVVFFSDILFVVEILLIWFSIIIMMRRKALVCLSLVFMCNIWITLFDFILAFFVKSYLADDFRKSFLFYNGYERILVYAVSRISFFFIMLWMYNKLNQQVILEKKCSLFCIVSGIIGLLGIKTFQGKLVAYMANQSLQNAKYLTLFFAICVLVMALYLYWQRQNIQTQMMLMKNEMLQKGYKEMQQVYQNSMFTYHDMKNHLFLLKKYLEQEKYLVALKYIEEICAPIEISSYYVWSENEILNLILNSKLLDANKKGIKVETSVDADVLLLLEESDLCIIISNLLDNAIEACEAMRSGKKWVRVVIKRVADINCIVVENSYEIHPTIKDGTYISRKVEKNIHGYGIKTIKERVEKYDGTFETECKDGKFKVIISFFRICKNESACK